MAQHAFSPATLGIDMPVYDPALASCPKCLNEEVTVTWHKSAVFDVIGTMNWACSGWPTTESQEHLCVKCARCQHCRAMRPADTGPYHAGKTDQQEETDMPIRKTGSAAGQVITDIEGETDDALARTASLVLREAPWSAQDESALIAENAQADEG
jgi:hypothetical protein